MRNFLKKLLGATLTRLASNASAPVQADVFKSLSKLLINLKQRKYKRGVVLETDFNKTPFIIFSDHHKGNKESGDDFAGNKKNYLAALDYYFDKNFSYINLGDSEELWKYSVQDVIAKNTEALAAESKFHSLKRYYKTFGNHDLTWKNAIDVERWFNEIFQMPLPVYEGMLLKTMINGKFLNIFLTHGHQGDKMSDNNRLSTWLVSHVWRPFQRYLQLNVNTPAKDFSLRDKHNRMMYEWSSHKNDLLLITGHTHKPVFASGIYSEEAASKISITGEEKIKLSYFNSGCCCYSDGDITGIEIENGMIRLIKWHSENDVQTRSVLEEMSLEMLAREL
ncbi:metallophosphoesterase family protein [soil metagenome]